MKMIEPEEQKEELFEHKKFGVDKGQEPVRIDKYLFTHIANSTRTRIQYAIGAGNVLVNGKPVKASYKIKPNDEISIVLAYPPKEITISPENIPLDILYEDNDVMVINKKAGMVVHPAYGNYTGTMVNALLYHLNGKDISLRAKLDDEKAIRPGLVHRLDKETSGLMVVGKNEFALARLAKEMYERRIQRKYLTIVWGTPHQKEGIITAHIGRSLNDRKKMAAFPDGNHGKKAVTHYRVIENMKYVSLVECWLETGRTHQIRVHMKHIGHPVFGDADYGGNKILKSSTRSGYKAMVEKCFAVCPRQALHAQYLSFTHPVSNKKMEFKAELPTDIKEVIAIWKHYILYNF